MHVQQQLRVERVVALARDGVDAVDARVHLVDLVGGRVRLGLRAEREGVRQDQRALQPLPRVALVHGGLVRAGHHERVRRLHEQRTRAAEEHGDLAVHLPRDAVGPEVAAVLRRRHGPSVRAAPPNDAPRTSAPSMAGLVSAPVGRSQPARVILPRHDRRLDRRRCRPARRIPRRRQPAQLRPGAGALVGGRDRRTRAAGPATASLGRRRRGRRGARGELRAVDRVRLGQPPAARRTAAAGRARAQHGA